MLLKTVVKLQASVILQILISSKVTCLGSGFSNKPWSRRIRWELEKRVAVCSWTLVHTNELNRLGLLKPYIQVPHYWENLYSLKISKFCVALLHSWESSRFHVRGGGDQVILYWNCNIQPILIFSFYLYE